METSANDASDQRFALILSELATLRAELNKDASSLPTDQGSSVISTPPAQEVVNNLSSSTSTPNDGIKDSNGKFDLKFCFKKTYMLKNLKCFVLIF
ncbi:uncharacterized protein LOC124808469 isoform X2 [Hydra vulgaris]|uniref:uncharacterized protein LOC124808469 isoform X2 n=1 Tax=Hydra vulgaris TaxID=6087 RepID=UPI0032E9CC4D